MQPSRLTPNFDKQLAQAEDSEGRVLADTLIGDAIKTRASDIHIDPLARAYRVRFRIDGALVDIAMMPKDIGERLVRAFQVASEIDQVSSRLSLDGRMSVPEGGAVRDIRVATVSSLSGDKITARLLHRGSSSHKLADLGMIAEDEESLREVIARQDGMVMISGPTGSGKTTTAYALLAELLEKGVNLVTLEDPIEFELDGATQVEVNEEGTLTYADGVRALLRHDPDCLFVGEIRDEAAAINAVEASFSGHGVISTLHTRSCVTTVMMLRSMGVPNHLLATALRMIINQRLVRRLCEQCKDQRSLMTREADLIESLGAEPPDRLFAPVGCDACDQTGYEGRFPLFEVWKINDDAYLAIINGEDERKLTKVFEHERSQSLSNQGLNAVTKGRTSLAEWRTLI
ncbi:MAG: type II secretory ATPase GspE/PulE/Tfp pilus assembly ATPase PilB-like protein [Verrucomicrobiales bacterium]|jgi:type II secretory ATPase GspE/PulE/Tfp pilus assembly ATPase PilB-like protein